jgi:hypothetical protein
MVFIRRFGRDSGDWPEAYKVHFTVVLYLLDIVVS